MTTATEREIWDVLLAMDRGKINVINTHKKICQIQSLNEFSLIKECLKQEEEIISSPIRFNGIHVEKLKEVFLKFGIKSTELDF